MIDKENTKRWILWLVATIFLLQAKPRKPRAVTSSSHCNFFAENQLSFYSLKIQIDKMKVLKLNKMFLKFCGISPSDEKQKPTEKALKVFTNYLLIFNSLSCGFFCAAYIYYHSNDISGVANALILLSGCMSVFGSYLGFLKNEPNMKLLHWELQSLVDSGK